MDAFDKLVAKHFPQAGPLQMLMEMVEEQLNEYVPKDLLKEEAAQAVMAQKVQAMSKSILDLMPEFEISEAWGQKDTEARKQFEVYMNNIPGASVEDKLRYLNLFIEEVRPGKYQTHEILSNLMFLDLLSTVVNNFSPSGAGFLFEAFLAGLLRGTQQIEKTEGELQIDDLRDAEGKPISLKLLVPTTPVKGSIKNLIGFLSNPANSDGIEYLCVYKFGKDQTKGLSFYSFMIDPQNIYYWLAKELKFDVTLAESTERRRTRKQQMTPEKIEKIMKKQAAARELVKQAQAFRARGSVKKKAMMSSPGGIKGSELVKKAGKEFGFEAPAVFDLTAQEIQNLTDEEVVAVLNARKKYLSSLNVPSDHELGDFRGAYKQVTGAEESVDYFKGLYEEDPVRWANELLGRANLKPLTAGPELEEEGMLMEAKESQFEINSALILKRTLPDIYRLSRFGYLNIDREQAVRLAEEYTDSLRDSVVALFSVLDRLTQGLTGYFLTPEGGNRFALGQEAVRASKEMNELITDPEKGIKGTQ